MAKKTPKLEYGFASQCSACNPVVNDADE